MATDMWAMGMCAYEVSTVSPLHHCPIELDLVDAVFVDQLYTNGSIPLGDVPNSEVGTKLMEGLRPSRLSTPPIPDSAWTLMQRSWELDPDVRPSFPDLSTVLDLYCSANSTDVRKVAGRISKKSHAGRLSGWPNLSQYVADLIRYVPSA